MQIGVIGLGRMGGNISRRLMKAGHHCVVFDVDSELRTALGEGWCPLRRLACRARKGARGEASRRLVNVAGGPDHRRDGRAAGRSATSG